MEAPRYTLLRIIANILMLLAALVLVASFVPWFSAALAPFMSRVPSAPGLPVSAYFMTVFMPVLMALPYAIALYVAGQILLLLVDIRVDLFRINQRLEKLHPPERS